MIISILTYVNSRVRLMSGKFLFLQCHKDHTLSVAGKQELDGNGVIELAKHGALYLTEKFDETASSMSTSDGTVLKEIITSGTIDVSSKHSNSLPNQGACRLPLK